MIQPERYHRIRNVLDRRQPDLTVLMDRVHKPHNFSAILRNCDAAGVLELHAVPPRDGLTLHHETSGGSAKWMEVHEHPDGPAAVDHLQARGFQVVAAHPTDDAVDFRDVDYTRPTAILVGAELHGVSEEALEAADLTAVIPMVGMVQSLNVSVATALFLYEAQRSRAAAGMYMPPSRLETERDRRTLFEWCYPDFARRFRDLALPYPELGEDGEIVGDLSPIVRPD